MNSIKRVRGKTAALFAALGLWAGIRAMRKSS